MGNIGICGVMIVCVDVKQLVYACEISVDRAEKKHFRGVARRILGYLWPPFVRQHDIYATQHSLHLLLTDILTDEQWD